MPDTPLSDTPDLYASLAKLRQAMARGSEALTINDVAHAVAPKGAVLICQTQAVVE